ncbi:MAG: DUF5671 domain-containing protein [Patescibacteria group bacterium]
MGKAAPSMPMEKTSMPASAPHKSTARDVFLHLFSLIALITCISSFITTVFQLLNLGFPVAELEGMYYARESVNYTLRTALSTLIVFFPAYMWSVWYTEKMFSADPSRATVGIRKWLVYFILFAASLTILINLVVTINTLLSGETTIRFLLKALSVLVVALGVGGYYLGNLRRYAVR